MRHACARRALARDSRRDSACAARPRDLALRCVRRALDSPRSFGHTHHVHHHVSCVYALLGDVDKAMAWLERAADSGFPCWPFFRIDPHLENLRDHPAFIQLMADLEQKYSARESSL